MILIKKSKVSISKVCFKCYNKNIIKKYYECRCCNRYITTNENYFKNHRKTCKFFKCNFCESIFASKKILQSHTLNTHTKPRQKEKAMEEFIKYMEEQESQKINLEMEMKKLDFRKE